MTGLYLYSFLISECHRDQAGQLTEGTIASEVAPQDGKEQSIGQNGLADPKSQLRGREELPSTHLSGWTQSSGTACYGQEAF